jgi:pimeloyl-ACP methyl ester carboxylesterase
MLITESYEHIPAELLAHQLLGAAACQAVKPFVTAGLRHGWPLRPELVDCPLRIVWGLADRVLPFPAAAERYRGWFPTADWVELRTSGIARSWTSRPGRCKPASA